MARNISLRYALITRIVKAGWGKPASCNASRHELKPPEMSTLLLCVTFCILLPDRKEERLLSSCHSLLGCRGIYCNPWHTLEFLKTVRHAYIELPFASTQIRFNLTEVWVLILCFLLYYQQNQKAINTEFLYLIRLWKSLRKCFIIKYKSQSNTT